jgi:TonB family protein
MPEYEPDVYTIDEVARAVGVPVAVVRAIETSGGLNACAPGYFAEAEVVRRAPLLRSLAAVTLPIAQSHTSFERAQAAPRLGRSPFVATAAAHVLLLAGALWLTSSSPATVAAARPVEAPRLVFLALPGAGGGGGGSGARQRRPAVRIERREGLRASVAAPAAALQRREAEVEQPKAETPAPAPTTPVAEPLPSRTVVAPIVMTSARTEDRSGTVEAPPAVAPSTGPGTGGRAGDGRGLGNGSGDGSGVGDGSGGGFGGGPYRGGSGIQPPRLLEEIKADYTEAARRARLSGNVVLEIVVRRDGGIGDVRVRRGLGMGLDERAIAAVRQWRFAPAERLGRPVDVVVEVAVEFRLR